MNDGTADQHADLVGLLLGELSNAQVLATEDHLHACAECRDDLVATATGHALLSRTSGVLGDLDLPAAPSFAPRVAHRRPRPGLVAAAAAVLVAGVGLGAAGAALLGSEEPSGRDLAAQPSIAAPLGPVEGDTEAGGGEVRMTAQADHSMRVTVQTAGLPRAPRGDFYYVWLLDPATNKMLPLGLVEPGGTATFRIDADLVASYGAVDVSLEADDGDPAHSVTSVLRGSYDLT
jgi:Anti-sigma-K factor rskA